MTTETAVGIFGGSGLYSLLDNPQIITVDTPFGPPSSPLFVGLMSGRRVVFLPRHGELHQFPAHRVNYRANVWAMQSVGVRAIIAPCSVGSLQVDIEPGHFVVIDQFVDRTSGRSDTFFDGPEVKHTSMAHPYDAHLSAVLATAARDEGVTVHEHGTVVTIQGPRFSTLAESRWFSSMGWHVVNMTQYPEVALANELGVPYGGLALVTDYDAGLHGRDDVAPVTMEQVFAFFRANIERVRGVLARAVELVELT
jgi:5'-methylthioadenosine phosphorylase